jgi:alanyl-tRNA synthetase
LTEELARKKGFDIDREIFYKEFEKHKEISRAGSEKKFKGGLADHSEEATKFHTATHLLHAALRQILGEHVEQKGSNITKERLRFDFSHSQKLTEEEKKKIEDLVNEKIKEDLPVICKEMSLEEAKKIGAIGLFGEKYGEKVKVYLIGEPDNLKNAYSKEICGGPHVSRTGELGHFKIKKEEAVSAGVRRIKAILE